MRFNKLFLLPTKYLPILLIVAFAIFFTASIANACCLCDFSGNGNTGTICLNTPIGKGCAWAEAEAKEKSNGQYTLTCVSISANQCQVVNSSPSALCPNKPIIASDFRSEYIEIYLGMGTKTPTDKTTSTVRTPYNMPSLGVEIPGITFEPPKAQNEYILISFIGAYISGFQKYLFGISIIAAAIMIIWGGFLYIYSAKGIDTQRAKDYIKDALMGLAIVLGAYLLLVNLNPQTVRLDPLKVKIVEFVPFPSERGYHEPTYIEPPEDWNPGKYVDPNAKPFNPLLTLDPSDDYENFYEPIDNPTPLRPVVVGDTPSKRMFSVCAPDRSILKSKSREEQIKYAAGVANVWITEGLINKGSVYIRTGFTNVNGSIMSCTNGTVDPIWYKRSVSYSVKGCGPVGSGQIAYGGAVMSCDEAMNLHEITDAFTFAANQLSSYAKDGDGSWPCNSIGGLDKNAQLVLKMVRADQPNACEWTASRLNDLAKRVGNLNGGLRLSFQRSLDSMQSPCRLPVTKHFQQCFTKKVGEAGYFCADCGTFLAQFMSCIGINPNNELFFKKKDQSVKVEMLSFHVFSDEEENNPEEVDVNNEQQILNRFETGSPNLSAPGGGDPNTFLGVVGSQKDSLETNQKAWRQFVEDVGGLQFGDMHFSNCHNYMFVGGAGLKYKDKDIYWLEMGGGGAADTNPAARVSVQSSTGQKLTPSQLDALEEQLTIVGRSRFPKDVKLDGALYSGLRIRFDPDISAYAGTDCGSIRGMWPIYIYRPFQDPPGTLRCDPIKPTEQSGCLPNQACQGNRRCSTLELGTICQDSRQGDYRIAPKEPTNCAVGQVCRSCTKEEIVEYGYKKPHSISGALLPVANMQKASYQLLPCYHNAFGSPTAIKYCMPIKSQEQIDFENSKYK
jgi:hypothetical protein